MRSLYSTTVLVTAVAAQFICPPEDLKTTRGHLGLPVRYKEVPEGICELTPGVKSFSGFVDVAEKQHTFFWFFEARDVDPKTAPLTVWINGGPGSSSMIGLFQENGPCTILPDGKLEKNEYSWNRVSNMLYVDQPNQTGFSYNEAIPAYFDDDGNIVPLSGNVCPHNVTTCGTLPAPNINETADSTIAGAPAMWKTLQGFLGAFPQYSHHHLHFATESYGGHYGPVYNKYFLDQNKLIAHGKLPGARRIPLETVMIGNGWFDPLTQYAAYFNFTVNPGNTYADFYNQSTKDQLFDYMYGKGNCYDQTVSCYKSGDNQICANADAYCANNVEGTWDEVTNRSEYDIRYLAPDPFPYDAYQNYLNTAKVQRAIGAFTNFTQSSITVSNAFGTTGDDDRKLDIISASQQIIDAGVYMIQYYGDADYVCNWVGGQAVAETIAGKDLSHAGFQNMSTSDHIVHGQVKQHDNFAFVRIYEAGHEVPFFQPLAALDLFTRAIRGRDIASGDRPWPGYRSVGPQRSTFREGNGTIQYQVPPPGATYNTTTNRPNPVTGGSKRRAEERGEERGRFSRMDAGREVPFMKWRRGGV